MPQTEPLAWLMLTQTQAEANINFFNNRIQNVKVKVNLLKPRELSRLDGFHFWSAGTNIADMGSLVLEALIVTGAAILSRLLFITWEVRS